MLLQGAPLGESFNGEARQLSNVLRGEQLHILMDDWCHDLLTTEVWVRGESDTHDSERRTS